MGLPKFETQGSLFESLGSIAPQLFDSDDRYKLFALKIWPLLSGCREELARCYDQGNGRPGVEPVVLLGVSIFQFLERIPDRQAVEMVKYHLGWKLALNLSLNDRGFHSTTLVNFRQRLLENDKGHVAFQTVLEALQKEGLIPKRAKQRLDSTHVLSAVREMSALECVRETLRLGLEALEKELDAAERPEFWPQLWERYVENKLDFRSAPEVLKSKQLQSGIDAKRLLEWVEPMRGEVRYAPAVELLRVVFEQQYEVVQGEIQRVKIHATGVVCNPHDVDAQWSAKREKHWVGYKVQVAETIAETPERGEEPVGCFITSVVTQKATESDDAGLELTLEAQKAAGLEKPAELYVDGAYVSGVHLKSAIEQNYKLVGPAQPSAGRANIPEAYRIEAFTIDIAGRQAICPGGFNNTQCSRLEESANHRVTYRFEWSTHCHGCALLTQCVGSKQRHRTIVVGENHDLLQARRIEQKSEGFKERMHQRNGIEGTISELTRAHGMRRNRYRGLAKARLQNLFIATACNIKRWLKLAGAKTDERASYFPAEALKKAFNRTLSAIPGVNNFLERLCRANNILSLCYVVSSAVC
jgi:transposase